VQYLNLGCGSHYHPDWINIDIFSSDPDVIAHDLRKGIPLPDCSCDVVYHSHVIEHFRRDIAVYFMKECFRVLKPGGIIRVAAPDAEAIARIYLEKLAALKGGDYSQEPDYEWIYLEMYDQTVREKSGGQMLSYLRHYPLSNESFVLNRIGAEGRNLISSVDTSPVSLKNKIQHISLKKVQNYILLTLKRFQNTILARIILGSNGKMALEIGQFRLSGEIHQWMYDSYSMEKLLISSGFRNVVRLPANESMIPEYESYHLDIIADGSIRKPDSFYMEAIRPIGISA
jgi:predicted SAM-dependent methyltransferase